MSAWQGGRLWAPRPHPRPVHSEAGPLCFLAPGPARSGCSVGAGEHVHLVQPLSPETAVRGGPQVTAQTI